MIHVNHFDWLPIILGFVVLVALYIPGVLRID